MIADKTVVVGEKEYTLRLDTRALRRIEDELGRPLTTLQHAPLGVGDLVEMLRCALLRHHPKATIEVADSIVDTIGLNGASELLKEMIEGVVGADPKDAETSGSGS